LEQAIPTAKPLVKRDEVKSVPIENKQPEPPKTSTVKRSPAPEAEVLQESEQLAMPRTREDAEARVQVLFRPTVVLNDRLKRFCDTNHATLQDTLSLAVEEFLSRRNS
jgi:hypothetical protein